MIIWFTGLSGSGKTTLCDLLENKLVKTGHAVYRVDGDAFRKKNKNKNAFTKKEILENNRKIISFCESIQKKYAFILVAAISPYNSTREAARKIFAKDYFEIFLDPSVKTLVERDPKKLYSKALVGEIKNLIGFSSSSPYERPVNPELRIDTGKNSINKSLKTIWNSIFRS